VAIGMGSPSGFGAWLTDAHRRRRPQGRPYLSWAIRAMAAAGLRTLAPEMK
jgi:hypothetical protein